jgi:hypothetical protein
MQQNNFFNLVKGLLAAALCTGALIAHAVTCKSNLQPSNPDADYTDHGDGTVTHTPTGLMWKRCAEGQTWSGSTCAGSTCTGSDRRLTWGEALRMANSSRFAGHVDWRLPSIKELRSLVEECRTDPSINDAIFPNTSRSGFWSVSPNAYNSYLAWLVDFDYGSAGYNGRGNGSLRAVGARRTVIFLFEFKFYFPCPKLSHIV